MSGRIVSTLKSLNLNCRGAARLLSDRMERPLSRPQSLGLSIHLLLCGPCRRYKQSIALLEGTMKLAGESETLVANESLPPAARERIRQKLGAGN